MTKPRTTTTTTKAAVPRRNAPGRTLRLDTAGSPKAAESAGTKYPGLASAIRAGDLASWHLADAAAREVARGMRVATKADWTSAIADLMAAGVAGIPSIGMLRQARATSLHYDPAVRVDGVSFTAHRLAKSVGDGRAAAAFLADLVAANGGNPAAVTVSVVQAAVRAQSANPVAGTTRKTAATKANAAQAASAVAPVPAPADTDQGALGALIRQARAVADQARALLADASDGDLDLLTKALARIGTAVDRETARRKAAATKAAAAPAKAAARKPGPKAKAKARPVVGMRG